MKAKFLSAVLLAASSLPLLLASAPASATLNNGLQLTRYMASSCHPTNASNAAHAQIDGSGRIFNTSPTQVLAVDCTVARDFFGGNKARVQLYAIDQKAHAGSALTCKLSMVSTSNGSATVSSLFGTSDTPSSPSATQQIFSETLTAGNSLARLSCFIPPAAADGSKQSGILGYDFVESL